jgi:hypothetical protein
MSVAQKSSCGTLGQLDSLGMAPGMREQRIFAFSSPIHKLVQ